MQASAKMECLEARVPVFLKRIIQRAADLQGRTITDFVVASLDRSARETFILNAVSRAKPLLSIPR